MSIRIMYDTTVATNIPVAASIDMVAGYVNGDYANIPALKARFPNLVVVSIDVNGTAPSADVRDWEPGDESNPALQQWVIDHNELTGKKDAVIYTSRDNIPQVRNLTGTQVLGTDYWLWEANLDGTYSAVYAPWTVAVQGENEGGYDRSLVYLDWWLPAPVRHPANQVGVVKSTTTGLSAPVKSVDGGHTWTWNPS